MRSVAALVGSIQNSDRRVHVQIYTAQCWVLTMVPVTFTNFTPMLLVRHQQPLTVLQPLNRFLCLRHASLTLHVFNFEQLWMMHKSLFLPASDIMTGLAHASTRVA